MAKSSKPEDLSKGHLHRWMYTEINGKRYRVCLICNATERA